MEDKAYRNAVKHRQELKAEILEIDKFLELWKRFSRTEPEQLSLGAGPAELPPAAVNGAGQKTKLSRDELAVRIREVLVKHGQPLTRGKLVKTLTDNNIAIGGTVPSRNLGTIMWRLKDQFTNIEGYGYWPKDLRCEEVGYEP